MGRVLGDQLSSLGDQGRTVDALAFHFGDPAADDRLQYLLEGAEIVAGTLDVLNELPAPGVTEIIQADEPTVFNPVIDFDADITRPASPDEMLPAR